MLGFCWAEHIARLGTSNRTAEPHVPRVHLFLFYRLLLSPWSAFDLGRFFMWLCSVCGGHARGWRKHLVHSMLNCQCFSQFRGWSSNMCGLRNNYWCLGSWGWSCGLRNCLCLGSLGCCRICCLWACNWSAELLLGVAASKGFFLGCVSCLCTPLTGWCCVWQPCQWSACRFNLFPFH